MIDKTILSIIAIGLTLLAFVPYITGILKGITKPHVFSWIIWGSTTFIVFLAQLEGHAGIGAWPIGVSGAMTVLVAFLAYLKRSDITITKKDWLFFGVAMSALPLWYLMSDPLWAVVMLTLVDTLGFAPTARKVYHAPYSEPIFFVALFFVRNMLVLFALEHYSATTVLFPAVIAIACLLLITLMIIRRHLIVR
ncbi:MAG: hypothetical protein KFB94_04965 [Methylophilaceae bacterium]|nr:MAG: hypothetical protein KFB94_04965 [Methylophilaceae bacterium]